MRDRYHVTLRFCFCQFGLHIQSTFQVLLRLFTREQRETTLFTEKRVLYSFSAPEILLETWVMKPFEGTKLAELVLLFPSSEDENFLTAVFWTVCFHWLRRGKVCACKWRPMNVLIWRNFLHSIRISLDHQLGQSIISHFFQEM